MRRRLIVVLTLSTLLLMRAPLAIALEDSDRLWRVGTSTFDDKLYPTARRVLEEFVAKYPDDRRAGEAWLLLGKARFAQQDLAPALDAFRRVLGLKEPSGKPGEAKFWEAETLFRLKRYAEAETAYDRALQVVLEKDPKLPFAADTMYGRAWAQLEQKHLEPAIKSFRDVLEAWPDSPLAPAATFALARTLVDLKRYEEALPLLSAFGTKYPKSPQEPEAQYLLGWTRLTAGQTAEAIQALRAFVTAHPTHELAETARRQLAEAVLQSGDRGELETEYRALMTAPRATPPGLYAAGQMAARLGRPEDQEAAWTRLRQEFPDDLLAQRAAFELAKSAYAAERWDDALTLAAAAAKNDELRADAHFLLGEAALKLKDYARALEAFKAVAALPGVDPGLRYRALAGSAVAREEQQQWREALALYEEVAQGSADAALQQWAREAVLALGKARLGAGDLEGGLEAFRRAEKLVPAPGRSQEARYWEAETLFRLKRFEEARGAYEALIRGDARSPLVPDTVYGLAWLELEQKRLEPAVQGFRQLLEKWPGHPLAADATFTLARTLVDAKRYEEAVPALRGFVTKYPTHEHLGDAQYLLGWAELATGQTAEGVKHLRAFLARSPSSELAASARRKLTEAVARLGDKGELGAQYRTLLADPSPTAEDLYDAALLAGQLGRPQDQEAAWTRLRQEFPDHGLAQRAALDLAHLAYAREKYQDAVTLASAATKTPEFQAEAALVVGEAKLKLKDYAGALDVFKTVTAPGVDAALRYRALAGSAVAEEEQRKLDAALALYTEVAEGSPDAALQQWARDRVGAVQVQQRRLREFAELDQATALLKAKKYADALAQGQALAQSEDANLRAGALLLVGDAELKLKQPAAALAAFDAAAAVPGLDAASRYRALAGSGVAHEEQQQWQDALARYQEIAAGSADGTLHQWARDRATVVRAQQERLARRLLELAEAAFKRKKYEEALGQARPVADTATGSLRADALLLVGQVQLKLAQHAAALEAFDAAAAVSGIQPLVQFRALAGSATAYEELRRWDEALQKYELIAASSPDQAQRKWARGRAAAVKARQTSPQKSTEKKPATES